MQDTVSDAEPEQDLLILPAAYSQGYAHTRVLQKAPPETEVRPDGITPYVLPQNLEPEANSQAAQQVEQGGGNGLE